MKIKLHISSKKFFFLMFPFLLSSLIIFLFGQDIAKSLESKFSSYKKLVKLNINFRIPNIQFIEGENQNKDLWIGAIFDAFTLVPFRTKTNKGSIPPPLRKKITIPKVDIKKQPPPVYNISMVYIGVNKKFAVINNRLLTEGDFISDKEYIVLIKKDGILLDGAWGKRWLKIK